MTAPRTAVVMGPSRRLTSSDEELRAAFLGLTTGRDIAALLEVSYSTLVFYTYRGRESDRYQKFEIPKRRGGTRMISAPTNGLKLIQQKLNQVLLAVYETRPPVHGFARDRSIASNASKHRRRRFVLNVDLEAFFPSINFGRVRGMFMGKPYSRNAEVATILAQICCFEDQLPQGGPTSPVVSNMICGKLDSDLCRLAQRVRATYTRYADDLTFSTNENAFPSPLAVRDQARQSVAGRELVRVVNANGFSLNVEKTRLLTRADRQEVTGLVVNQKLNVRRAYVRQIRSMLHHLRVDGGPNSLARQVKGCIDFVGQVRGQGDPVYRRLLAQYASLVRSFMLPNPPDDELVTSVAKSVWVVEWMDDAGDGAQGTAVLIRDVGFITCAHVLGSGAYACRAATPEDRRDVDVIFADAELDLALIAIEGVSPTSREGLALSLIVPEPSQRVYVAGFPDFAPGATLQIHPGHIAGRRIVEGVPILSLGASIFAGASGSPVVNEQREVIGIAVRGADNVAHANRSNRYGAIPVTTIREFLERAQNAKISPWLT
jgi:RNA-directed DNA polymerase